ncbi:YhgE/Pip family protein [Pseudonocardia sp. CA-107938]|uniref:YhgE/Pip family protein n=1 Tax=Pseudonocardia sp. CA-107938 TaxID=3240021 RepID=UPI003D8CA4D7
MTSIRMAISELRRITAGRLPALAVLALCMIPLLYGGLYLYANHDPYSKLDDVPAALVVADTGARQSDSTVRNVGADVAKELLDGHAFDWHQVSAAEAADGVREGRYTFSLTLPADFTEALTSSSNYTPRQAMLVLTTNDANGYLVRTIAGTLTSRVHDSVAKQVGTEAADKFLTGFATVHDKLSEAADGAGQLATGAGTARNGATQLASGSGQLLDGQRKLLDGATQLHTGAVQLAEGLDKLHEGTRTLPEDSAKLADGAEQVAAGNRKLADAGAKVAGVSQEIADQLDSVDDGLRGTLVGLGLSDAQVEQGLAALHPLRAKLLAGNDKLQEVNGQLGQLADGSEQVAQGARKLADAAPALADGIAQADEGAHKLADGAAQLATGEKAAVDGTIALNDGAGKLATGVGQLGDGATKLSDGLHAGLGDVPNLDPATRDATARTIGDPLAIQNTAQNEAADYGAGLAPFFMTLATWIGAYVLFLLLQPLSSRALAANQTPLRVALGGWLPAALLGILQTTALYAVIVFGIGIHPVHPVLTLLTMWLAAGCFTAIIHALNAALGAVGQFLGLVLMVLQLVSSGGTFPWQTIPDPLYPLHYALPMSYVIDALRHLIYGGELGLVAVDVGVVVAWLAVALLVATRAARTRRVWTASRVRPELVL